MHVESGTSFGRRSAARAAAPKQRSHTTIGAWKGMSPTLHGTNAWCCECADARAPPDFNARANVWGTRRLHAVARVVGRRLRGRSWSSRAESAGATRMLHSALCRVSALSLCGSDGEAGTGVHGTICAAYRCAPRIGCRSNLKGPPGRTIVANIVAGRRGLLGAQQVVTRKGTARATRALQTCCQTLISAILARRDIASR